MKVTNLSRKPFLIPVDKAQPFMLIPAGGVVELPTGSSKEYIDSLAKNGSVRIDEADEPEADKYTESELSEMHYKQVDVVAEEFGLTTDGNKSETIQLILEAQG